MAAMTRDAVRSQCQLGRRSVDPPAQRSESRLDTSLLPCRSGTWQAPSQVPSWSGMLCQSSSRSTLWLVAEINVPVEVALGWIPGASLNMAAWHCTRRHVNADLGWLRGAVLNNLVKTHCSRHQLGGRLTGCLARRSASQSGAVFDVRLACSLAHQSTSIAPSRSCCAAKTALEVPVAQAWQR